MAILSAPHVIVALINDHSGRTKMIGVNEVNLNRAGCGRFPDHGHRNIFQPDGFLSDEPVIRRCRGTGIVPVFADQLSGFIIEESKLRTQRTILADALIQGIVFVRASCRY